MPIISLCDSVAQEKILKILKARSEFLEEDEETKRMYRLLGRLSNCADEVPEQERQMLLKYLEKNCGSLQADEPLTTYAEAARISRPCLENLLEE